MKFIHSRLSRKKGYALITVLMFIGIMAVLTASMLKFSGAERRMNERSRLLLRARNMAENAVLYASEQLTTKLYRIRSTTPMAFMTGSNQIYPPPASVLTTAFSTPGDVEIRAGLKSSTGLDYVDPTVAANASNPNVGLSVSTSEVPVIAKATMRHPSLGLITAYAQQDLQIALMPLFQFAVFYNMDMEYGPGPTMVVDGPVHTNGNLIARIQTGFDNTLQFADRVTAAGGFYADTAYKGVTYMGDGSVDSGPGGTGPLYFENLAGVATNIKNKSNVWRDHKFGTTKETNATSDQFKTFATSTFGSNFRTRAHGVTRLELPSIGGYKEDDDPKTTEDDRLNGRQLIEAPSPEDTADLVQAKYSRRSGLYIMVNPDDEARIGRLPNGSTLAIRGHSYRAWLNTVNGDGSHSLAEVILPGQPSWGADNAHLNRMPNAYRTDTSVGHNQVLRIPSPTDPSADYYPLTYTVGDTGYAGPAVPLANTPAQFVQTSFTDSYFYDLRRGKGSNSYPFARGAKNFIPRPIAKIDFDMTRFKMAVERTLLEATSSTVFTPSAPNGTNWSQSIYNASATAAAHGLGLGGSSNNFDPRSITVNAVTSNGTSDFDPDTAWFEFAESTTGVADTDFASPAYTSTSEEASHTFTAGTATKYVRVKMYLKNFAATAASLVDQQIFPILPVDESAPTAELVLSNEFHINGSSSPSSSGTLGSTHFANADKSPAYTEARVYVGGIDDTSNWTFTTSVSNGTVERVAGTDVPRFRLTDITFPGGATTAQKAAAFATVTINATKAGTTKTKLFTVKKESGMAAAYATPANRTTMMVTGSGTGTGGDPFQIYYAPADPDDTRIVDSPEDFKVGASNLVSTSTSSPWFDGVTVYVHSVGAEDKTDTDSDGNPDRVDSGVRLWNGRGSVISLDGTTYPLRTGFSFVTNDALYVVGHFNADGSINSNANSKGTGGYSGRYPEATTEMLCAVMGDAITLLSQPLYTQSGSSYYQTSGWADSLSGHRRSDSGWSSSWSSTNPSGSNSVDGIATSIIAAKLPNLTSKDGSNQGSAPSNKAVDSKFAPSVTEISTCLLTGIVRTTSTSRTPTADLTSQTSGGVHNFPRLLENWAGTGLYIRGSMVAMFESRVATEPWSIRYYQGAGRYWGLHERLRAQNGAHDLPLEPIVLNAQRMSYREITAAQYATQKAEIEALPH